jgi:hypothetical protein
MSTLDQKNGSDDEQWIDALLHADAHDRSPLIDREFANLVLSQLPTKAGLDTVQFLQIVLVTIASVACALVLRYDIVTIDATLASPLHGSALRAIATSAAPLLVLFALAWLYARTEIGAALTYQGRLAF